ncbi:hypothetical protein ROZALSC1DRAFT_31456, partial [Rozella allomycis CSF55]
MESVNEISKFLDSFDNRMKTINNLLQDQRENHELLSVIAEYEKLSKDMLSNFFEIHDHIRDIKKKHSNEMVDLQKSFDQKYMELANENRELKVALNEMMDGYSKVL